MAQAELVMNADETILNNGKKIRLTCAGSFFGNGRGLCLRRRRGRGWRWRFCGAGGIRDHSSHGARAAKGSGVTRLNQQWHNAGRDERYDDRNDEWYDATERDGDAGYKHDRRYQRSHC